MIVCSTPDSPPPPKPPQTADFGASLGIGGPEGPPEAPVMHPLDRPQPSSRLRPPDLIAAAIAAGRPITDGSGPRYAQGARLVLVDGLPIRAAAAAANLQATWLARYVDYVERRCERILASESRSAELVRLIDAWHGERILERLHGMTRRDELLADLREFASRKFGGKFPVAPADLKRLADRRMWHTSRHGKTSYFGRFGSVGPRLKKESD